MKKVLGEIAYRIHRNPVLVATALLWGQNALSTGDPITWRGAVYVAVGVIVRSRVVPANEVTIITEFLDHILKDVQEGEKA